MNCEVLHNCHMAQPEFEEKSANCKFVSLSTFTISSFKNGFPDGSMGKESACNAGGTGFEALGQEDLLEEENGNPLQHRPGHRIPHPEVQTVALDAPCKHMHFALRQLQCPVKRLKLFG